MRFSDIEQNLSLFVDGQNRKNHQIYEVLERSIDDNQRLMTAELLGIIKETVNKIEKTKEMYFTKIREAFNKCNNDRQFFFKSKMDQLMKELSFARPKSSSASGQIVHLKNLSGKKKAKKQLNQTRNLISNNL